MRRQTAELGLPVFHRELRPFSNHPLAGCLGGIGLCYRQLARHFESHFGISPKRFQMIRRVEEAQRLLEMTGLPITTIALELGFGSSQHFASRFRQITGKPPTAVRART